MNKKTQTLVVLGLVAVGGYMWWKSRQDDTSEFSNIGGGKYRRMKKHLAKWELFCLNHPNNPKCGGGGGSASGGIHDGGGYTKPRYTSRR